jgi:S-adenosylmethionine:tRNA ribosyltransferase-isomerase
MDLNKTSSYNYILPPELIAQTPVYPRDSSRMLYYNGAGGNVEHLIFRDVSNVLKKGDLLVINETKVIPARLFARDERGRIFETLILKRRDYNKWEALLKPARKAPLGSSLTVSEELSYTVEENLEDGVRLIDFRFDGVFEDILNRVGVMPLPPYIKETLKDASRYNTVYAKVDGSAAAPTAGLHFTPELLAALKKKGVEIVEILLNVGLGTFRPVKTESITDHIMHREYYEISEKAAAAINKALEEGRRVIAVGTTSVRTLESAAENGRVKAGSGETGIFIYPPYDFKIVKGLITNFHLPESTLIMLVSAFIGREKTLELYELAVKEKYRFFSFGDAMLIL